MHFIIESRTSIRNHCTWVFVFGPIIGFALAQDVFGTDPQRIFGAIATAEKVDLSFRREGAIKSIQVRIGESIREGQEVIQIDDREFNAKVALAESELRKSRAISEDESSVIVARSQLAKAEAAWKTHAALKQKTGLELFRLEMELRERQAAFDMSISKNRQERIDVEIKEEMRKLAMIDAEACVIKSPLSGVVAEQWKHAGESVRSGEPILRIQRMDRLEFRVEFSERITPANSLSNRQAEIEFHGDTSNPIRIQGVRFDRVVPSNLDDEHYYALAYIDNSMSYDQSGNPHWRLRPGMSGEVRLHELRAPDLGPAETSKHHSLAP